MWTALVEGKDCKQRVYVANTGETLTSDHAGYYPRDESH